ncbi:MAG: LON peptidase substrate-binding domain-containing protein [Acidimicrobiales bacterium]
MSAALPMFPLDTVLFPGLALPLHIFEPRYRSLVADCLEADRQFGVVLIERGYQVGGGESRFGVGTVARIVQEAAVPDGRWVLLTVGTRRIRIEHWLPDAPYPLALVQDLGDAPPTDGDLDAMARVERQVRRALAYAAEMDDGPTVPSTVELVEDPEAACWQLCAISPLAQLDHQRLLEAGTVPARLALLEELTIAACEDLLARLSGA